MKDFIKLRAANIILLSVLLGYIPVQAYASINYEVKNSTVRLDTPFDFHNWSQWTSLGSFITRSNYKVYILNWKGVGGDVAIGKDFVEYIKQAQRQGKVIIINLTGDAYSVHAFVTCYADKINNPHNRFLMFHADESTYTHRRYTYFTTSLSSQFQNCVNRGILPQASLDKMWSGYEVYIDRYKVWYLPDMRPVS